jgi:phosphatidylserine decarboxylase
MNSGKANKAAIRLLLWSVAVLAGLFAAAWIGKAVGGFVCDHPALLIAPWALFLVAVLYFFRDPDPIEPSDLSAIVAPAHGKVDVIEDAMEASYIKGACKRVSIRVSLLDVQVQNAPVTGTIAQWEHQPAAKTGGMPATENLFIGFDVVGRAASKLAVRLIGGTWGKRIVPWVRPGDVVSRSARIGMMRPAARVELYLPSGVKLHVNLGDEVAGGQSIVAKFE